MDATLTEHWDGARWSLVTSPNIPGEVSNSLRGVTPISTNDVWAAGFTFGDDFIGSTLTEHWDGTAWNVVANPKPTPSDNVFYGISASGSSDVWAVGSFDDQFDNTLSLTEHWDGSRWAIVPSPSPGHSAFMYGVAALPLGTAWAAGVGGGGPIGQYWRGSKWKPFAGQLPGDLSNQFFGVAALSDRSVWAVGEWSNSQGPTHTLVEYFC